MTTVLSIGTTHPWNIAGVGLDMLVGHELGVRVVTVRTAVSAQDERGLHGLETLSGAIIRAQFDYSRPQFDYSRAQFDYSAPLLRLFIVEFNGARRTILRRSVHLAVGRQR